MNNFYAEDCLIASDLKPEIRNEEGEFPYNSEKEKIDWPVAHYIGTDYNFKIRDSKIENVIGLAGYFPVAHKDFNDFYGSLKGGDNDFFKFNSLKKRSERERWYSGSKDIIICPWDNYYKPTKNVDLDKIERGDILLDSIELAKKLSEKGLKNKIGLIIYDKGFEFSPLRNKVNEELDKYEEAEKYINKLSKLSKKYGIEFIEKIDLPYPYLLYEHLRTKNKDLFN